MSWEQWIQDVGKTVVDTAAAVKERQYETEQLRLQALGEGGYYTEGQQGTKPPAVSAGLSLSPTMLLLAGAAVVAVLLMRSR